jgi:ABC-type Fe3+-hydroxamate transport system substrate-binding protein
VTGSPGWNRDEERVAQPIDRDPASTRGALTDAAGVSHSPAGPEPRIVCLVPSITELLVDLGLLPHLVGRTRFCVHPRDELRQVANVGGTKQVKLERIRSLQPSHVVVNVDENPRETYEALCTFVPHVIVTHPRGPADNVHLYRLLGGIFDRRARAERLCERLGEALAAAREAAQRWARRRVLYLIWKDPWMTVGRDTYISRTLATVGLLTIPDQTEPRYPEVNLGSLVPAEVDDLLLSSEPFPFQAKHIAALRQAYPALGQKARLIDGEMASWYGSRAIVGLSYLSAFALALSRQG